jgi:hypothetical protein
VLWAIFIQSPAAKINTQATLSSQHLTRNPEISESEFPTLMTSRLLTSPDKFKKEDHLQKSWSRKHWYTVICDNIFDKLAQTTADI